MRTIVRRFGLPIVAVALVTGVAFAQPGGNGRAAREAAATDATGASSVTPTGRSTEGCPQGFEGTHGQFVSSTDREDRRGAAQSNCGMPLTAQQVAGDERGAGRAGDGPRSDAGNPTGSSDVSGTPRSTEDCPEGFSGNHGEFVRGTEKGDRSDAAHTDCGKPTASDH